MSKEEAKYDDEGIAVFMDDEKKEDRSKEREDKIASVGFIDGNSITGIMCR